MIRPPTIRTAARIGSGTQAGFTGGTFRRRRPDPAPVNIDGVRWVCARARPGREFAVADDLAAMGFRVFCPHGVRVYMRARMHGSDVRRRAERDYPVFGAYVFVGEPDGVFLSRHTHWHVMDVLQNAGGSRRIPSTFVEVAASAWCDRRWDGRVKIEDIFLGKRVKITSGSLKGHEAVVDSLPSELRAVVTMTMFGGARPVEVDVDTLEVL